LLTHAGIGCNAFLGGITANYGTNLLLSATSDFTVVEADEFDRSFLTLHPTLAAITSMDPDHLDIYGDADSFHEGFRLFAAQVKEGGILLAKAGLPLQQQDVRPGCVLQTYSISENADYTGRNIRVESGQFHFDLHTPQDVIAGLYMGLPGRHNVENAIAASALALACGVTNDQIRTGLATFRGVKRRFEYVVQAPSFVMIDDYAHHPEELRAAIGSARELFPDKRITGVFQPHLFSRTRDFMDGFAEVLGQLDDCILLPIYPARELPIPGIDSQVLLDKISCSSKKLVGKSELLAELSVMGPEVLLMLGAGDIDALVQPIAENLGRQ
jgi:UDP-N-acetylmuramate--alanine ligase